MSHQFSVRAVDCGYGHIKFADGRDEAGAIRCDSFPSQSPTARGGSLDGGVIQRRDTFLVEINGRRFEVGKGVALAGQTHRETEVLDHDFSLSDAYTARLYGALSYMYPDLKSHTLDFLVLGLPLNTYPRHHAELSRRFVGEHKINAQGDALTVRRCQRHARRLTVGSN